MAEAAGAHAGSSRGIRRNVEDDVVGMRRIPGEKTRGPRYRGKRSRGSHMVELEQVSNAPGDVVIRTRSISADPEPAHDHVPLRIQREPAAEDVDAADA